MTTVYSISDRKEKIIAHIMKDERLTIGRREQIVKQMFELEQSDKFVLQDFSDPRHVCFPHLHLLSKKANVSLLTTQDLKGSHLQLANLATPVYSVSHNDGRVINIAEKPIFVDSIDRRNQERRLSIGAAISKLKLESIQKVKNNRKGDEVVSFDRSSLLQVHMDEATKRLAFQKKLAEFRQRIKARLKEKSTSPQMIGNIMRCIDESLVFDFLQRYEGCTMSIDEVIQMIVKSLGSDFLPAYNLDNAIEDSDLKSSRRGDSKNSNNSSSSRNQHTNFDSFARQQTSDDLLNAYNEDAQKGDEPKRFHTANSSSDIVRFRQKDRKSTSALQPRRQRNFSKSPTRATNTQSQEKNKGIFPWQNNSSSAPQLTQFSNDLNQPQSLSSLNSLSSANPIKKEQKDIEVATVWLSSVNKKLANDELLINKPKNINLFTSTKTDSTNEENKQIKKTFKVKKKDKIFPLSKLQSNSSFSTDHREVYREMINAEKMKVDSNWFSQSGKSLSFVDNKVSKSKKGTKPPKAKHIAILPTIPKIVSTEATNYDFNPFAKYRDIPTVSSLDNKDEQCIPEDGNSKAFPPPTRYYDSNQPITPYLSAMEERVVKLSGVASGAGISLIPEDREKMILDRQKQKDHIRDFINAQKSNGHSRIFRNNDDNRNSSNDIQQITSQNLKCKDSTTQFQLFNDSLQFSQSQFDDDDYKVYSNKGCN